MVTGIKKVVLSLFIGLVFVSSATPAFALDLNLGLNVGVDKKTRALIEKMPAEIRMQIEKLLADALPLIDKSVLLYLDRVDEILADRLSQIDCSLTGVSKTATEELITKLEPWKNGPTIVADLQKSVDDYPKKVKKNFTPKQYRIKYADLLNNAHTVACAVNSTPAAEDEVMKIRVELTSRIRPWVRLEDETCVDAPGCFQLIRSRTASELSLADARDSADPKVRLDAIQLPEKKLMHFDPIPYEKGLRSLYEIADEVKIKTAIRDIQARQKLVNATRSIDELDASIKSGQQAVNTTIAGIDAAINSLGAHAADKSAIETLLNSAVDILPTAKSQSAALWEKTRLLHEKIDPTIASLRASRVALENKIPPEKKCSGGGGKTPKCDTDR